MIRKSVFNGILFGLLLTVLLLYPTFYLFIGRVLPGIGRPVERLLGETPEFGSGRIQYGLLLIMVLAGLSMLLVLLSGIVAAWRSCANTIQSGMLAGMVSGMFSALVVYIFLVAPTAAILSGADLLTYPTISAVGQAAYPRNLMVPFARFVLVGEVKFFLLSLLGGLLVGGFEGALVGLLRRGLPSVPRPVTILDSLQNRDGYREWFANYEEPVMSGLVTGVLGGIILILGDYLNKSTVVASSAPTSVWLDNIFSEAMQSSPMDEVHIVLLPLLLALSFLVVIGMGGVAAYLPKNPPGFLRSRVFAATVSGTMIGLLIAFATTGYVRFGIVLLPGLIQYDPSMATAGDESFMRLLLSAQMRVLLMYLVPLPLIAVMAAGYTVWGTIQGLVYSLIFALFKLRPVDRARAMRRDISQNGDQFLPRLYALFQRDRQAVQVLEHLAFDLKSDPAKARVTAAYHTLATRPELALRALDEITRALESQTGCKLCNEIMGLHGLLAQGLRARTLAQITVLLPLPEHQTSSLLPPLVKAGEYLSRPLIELKKVERVDDLSSKIIFLSNALENLRQARIYSETAAHENFATLAPEINVLRLVLEQWEAVVLATIRDIQGRAELTAVLKTNKVSHAEDLSLTVLLNNQGLNVAECIRLQVDGFSDEYTVVEGGTQTIEILAPQDSRELTFTIRPTRRGRLRVCWKVSYTDAVKDQDVLEFADQVEFIEADKPFQRIFPIPYVTGTPLQGGQMFVGRQDVFAFVHEHLLGTYQNNVIVLHGQRRTGKSSILYRLGSELAETHFAVLVDMQGKAARGEVDFLYSIADDIVYALENKGIEVELPARKEFEESPEFFFRSRFLRGVYQALGEKNLLLMFDEFEELQKRVEDGKLTADIFPFLRNLMQHERRLDFIFAGTHKLEELAAEYWSILFNIAIYKRITFLDLPEVERLVRQPVQASGMEYDPLAVERIYQVTSGHPYFTQVVCHELVAFHNDTQRSYITVTDVETCIGRILERGEAHFKYIWAESSVVQRLALLALAECLETEEAATLEDLLAMLERRGRPQPPDDLLDSLGNLEARDIVMRSGPRSTLYRFRVDLIRRWVYAARPAYEKVL